MCNKSNNKDTFNYLKEYQDFRKILPHWASFVFPITMMGFGVFVLVMVLIKCEWDWIFYLFLIIGGLVLLLASLFVMKQFTPYWTKIAELNDKQTERLIKLAEERLEHERYSEKVQTAIIEKYAKTLMDEDAKNGDNQRKLVIMQQEYVSHLADIALEIVKSNNNGQGQVSDQQMINQIIQQLIRQSNGQQ